MIRGFQNVSRRTVARKAQTGLAVAAVAALTVLMSACSAPADTEAEQGLQTDTEETVYADWLRDFQKCLSSEGIDLNIDSGSGGSIGIDTDDFDMEAFETAQNTCIDKVGEPPAQAGQMSDADQQEAASEFTKCLRSEGYDVPDPDPSGGAQMLPTDVDQEVLDKCMSASNASAGN